VSDGSRIMQETVSSVEIYGKRPALHDLGVGPGYNADRWGISVLRGF